MSFEILMSFLRNEMTTQNYII